MAGFRIEGNTSGNVAEVDTNNNIKVNLPTTATQAGFSSNTFQVDAGAITGTKLMRTPFVSEKQRLSVGNDSILANYNFTTTSQNTGKFKHQFTTMTCTQTSGFLNINPALATVSGNYAYMQTWKHFSLQGDAPIKIEFTGKISAAPAANQIFEAGLFLGVAGSTAPADGIFFRLTSSGLIGVISYNGTETTTGTIISAGSMPTATVGEYRIIVSQRSISFWIQNAADDAPTLGASLTIPNANAVPFQTLSLPACMQMRNTNTVTGGMTVQVGTFNITQADYDATRPWPHQMANQGSAYQGQDGDTMGSLAIYSNAALAAAAALTNTTAAAGNTGLGGVVLVLPTLTAGTDGILLSYQNPTGSVTQPPKTLVVTGVTISAGVQTALTGGPLNYVMGAAFGHTALSLATTDTGSFVTNTTKSPRRVPIGVLNAVVTAAAGTGLGQINAQFASPLVINPGEYFAITARNVGTVTSAGAVVFAVNVDHYFE